MKVDKPRSIVQAQILELLRDLQRKFNLTYMFISHDIGVVKYMSNRMAVMYLGKMVKMGPSNDVFEKPLYPYTKFLLAAVPVLDPKIARSREKLLIRGKHPSPINPPPGCRFHLRWAYAMDICSREEPPQIEVGRGCSQPAGYTRKSSD